MRSFRSTRGAAASISALAVGLLIGVATASAATTLTYDPDRATPGTRVTIHNACLGVTDNPSDELAAAFLGASSDLQPTDPSVPRGVAKASGRTAVYVVVVPELKPGPYQIRLECLPGDWRTNTAEGGTLPLRILSGAPDTSTGSPVGARTTPGDRLEGLLLLGLGLVAWIAAFRRLTQRRARTG